METTIASLEETTSEGRKFPGSAAHDPGEQEGEGHLAAAEAGSHSPARSASGSASPLNDYVSTRNIPAWLGSI